MMEDKIQVDIVAHTRLPNDAEFVSWRWRLPAFLDGEWRTHRQISKNASSFRAIPISRMIENVTDDPFIRWHWTLQEKGMQGHRRADDIAASYARSAWLEARDACVKSAMSLATLGLHKQDANRLLQPWVWMEWLNTARVKHLNHLYALRDEGMAEPHFKDFVVRLMEEVEDSKVESNDAHLPYVSSADRDNWSLASCAYASAARCRRVSLFRLDGTGDSNFAADVASGEEMAMTSPLHATPFEHQVWTHNGAADLAGNFAEPRPDGVVQFRKIIGGEYTRKPHVRTVVRP